AALLEGAGLAPVPSIGFLPAVLALSLYSVLPMLRNTVTGLAGVDPALVEAARGVGMDPREVLWQVELPLALPTIVAGLRTATVWVVGMATLATPVGGTSLGNPIFAGLQTRNLSAVLVGSAAAAVLAIVLDAIVRLAETGFEARSRGRVASAFGLLSLIAIVALGFGARGAADATRGPSVTIGAKSFTEQYVLARILAGVAEGAGAGTVEEVPSLGSTVAFDALVSGDLDLYVDYTGTLWATILKRARAGEDRATVLETVRTRLAEDHGVVLLAALGFENTYCLAMRGEDARDRGVARISDLTEIAGELEILGDFEFFERPEWRAIEGRYALRFATERAMDAGLMYEALRTRNGDVISAYSTDGRIEADGLAVLEDDRGVIPPYDAVVLASRAFVERAPGIARAVRALGGRIDAGAMRRMNAQVDLEGRAPAAVAAAWLAACAEQRGSCAAR
ncbi:MAG: ABC transporter permease/substrate-binding protein, partial [Myxococcota bacterium]